MLRAIFLDIDNTLLDFDETVRQTMREGFAAFGLPDYRDEMFSVFRRVNVALWEQIESGQMDLDELMQVRWNRIFEALGIGFDGVRFEQYFRERLFTGAIPEPHAREMLSYLKEKYILCAASNGPTAQQINRLKIAGMRDAFDHLFISREIGASKPSSTFFDRCFARLRAAGLPDLTPDQTMIIGDSLSSDIAGGRQYGMQTCWYCRGDRPKPPTPAADYTVTGLEQIATII